VNLDITISSGQSPPASGLGAELAADMAAAIEVYDQSFFWRGFQYPCVISSRSSTLIVAKALFTGGEYPARGDAIMIAGKNRQVVKLNNSALRPSLGGLIEDRPFVDDPADPALSIEFGKLINA